MLHTGPRSRPPRTHKCRRQCMQHPTSDLNYRRQKYFSFRKLTRKENYEAPTQWAEAKDCGLLTFQSV